MGIGQSGSEKQDRATLTGAQSGLSNVFNFGLPAGEAGQKTGQATLTTPQSYFQSLLNPTRTSTAINAAPAIGAAQNQKDALARQQATLGTSRTGGATAANAEAGATTASNIDQIINQNLVTGQQTGAAGLESIGSTELQNALSLLGIGGNAASTLASSAASELQSDVAKENALGQAFGGIIGTWLGGGFSGAGQGSFSLSNPLGIARNAGGITLQMPSSAPGPTPPPINPFGFAESGQSNEYGDFPG